MALFRQNFAFFLAGKVRLDVATLDETPCEAKFLTSVKFLTYYCMSVTLLLRVKE